jgi:hypothetical protein
MMKHSRLSAATLAAGVVVLLSTFGGGMTAEAQTASSITTTTFVAQSNAATPVAIAQPTSVSRDNATEKALDYLAYTSFSRTGLIKQLMYEGFSRSDATYGADATHANWYKQAALKAAEYMDYSAFSRSGLIAQLKYEGFTAGQAIYGAKSVGY